MCFRGLSNFWISPFFLHLFSFTARLNHDHVFVHGLYGFPASAFVEHRVVFASVYVLPHAFFVQLQVAAYAFALVVCAAVPRSVYVVRLSVYALVHSVVAVIAVVVFVPIHDAQFHAYDVLILPVVDAVDIPNADDHSHNVDHHNHGDVHNEDHNGHLSNHLQEMRHNLQLKKQSHMKVRLNF